jgi:hypothetical protein
MIGLSTNEFRVIAVGDKFQLQQLLSLGNISEHWNTVCEYSIDYNAKPDKLFFNSVDEAEQFAKDNFTSKGVRIDPKKLNIKIIKTFTI